MPVQNFHACILVGPCTKYPSSKLVSASASWVSFGMQLLRWWDLGRVCTYHFCDKWGSRINLFIFSNVYRSLCNELSETCCADNGTCLDASNMNVNLGSRLALEWFIVTGNWVCI